MTIAIEMIAFFLTAFSLSLRSGLSNEIASVIPVPAHEIPMASEAPTRTEELSLFVREVTLRGTSSFDLLKTKPMPIEAALLTSLLSSFSVN